MVDSFWHAAFSGLGMIVVLAGLTWLVSLARRDVSIVDSLWSLFITTGGVVYAWLLPWTSWRPALMLTLAAAWALRLAIYIIRRNHGHGEDRRYQQIRARNQPNFAFKSLYLVFGLQAVLAWIVSAPFLAGFQGSNPINALDLAGTMLAAFGIVFEAVGDQQMARFKADPANQGQVMDRGLWRFSRHPNYFGECCTWWGLYLIALAAGGAWWSVVSPLLMTVLLLKVSGVSLLEADIGERRPAYRDYIARTPAFVPWRPRRKQVT
jgi:steroid 5-alpha reductase family enzyme